MQLPETDAIAATAELYAAPSPVARLQRPLCVDLDGALVKSDTLFDAFCQLVHRQPMQLWRVPLWLAGGKARLKIEVAKRAPLDVTRLPYNGTLLRYLQAQRREGRVHLSDYRRGCRAGESRG